MKTFPEYFQDSIDMTDGSVVAWEKDYKAIQLDAMKEGMRRAAGIATSHENWMPHYGSAATQKAIHNRILSTAEQLTDKDLA